MKMKNRYLLTYLLTYIRIINCAVFFVGQNARYLSYE